MTFQKLFYPIQCSLFGQDILSIDKLDKSVGKLSFTITLPRKKVHTSHLKVPYEVVVGVSNCLATLKSHYFLQNAQVDDICKCIVVFKENVRVRLDLLFAHGTCFSDHITIADEFVRLGDDVSFFGTLPFVPCDQNRWSRLESAKWMSETTNNDNSEILISSCTLANETSDGEFSTQASITHCALCYSTIETVLRQPLLSNCVLKPVCSHAWQQLASIAQSEHIKAFPIIQVKDASAGWSNSAICRHCIPKYLDTLSFGNQSIPHLYQCDNEFDLQVYLFLHVPIPSFGRDVPTNLNQAKTYVVIEKSQWRSLCPNGFGDQLDYKKGHPSLSCASGDTICPVFYRSKENRQSIMDFALRAGEVTSDIAINQIVDVLTYNCTENLQEVYVTCPVCLKVLNKSEHCNLLNHCGVNICNICGSFDKAAKHDSNSPLQPIFSVNSATHWNETGCDGCPRWDSAQYWDLFEKSHQDKFQSLLIPDTFEVGPGNNHRHGISGSEIPNANVFIALANEVNCHNASLTTDFDTTETRSSPVDDTKPILFCVDANQNDIMKSSSRLFQQLFQRLYWLKVFTSYQTVFRPTVQSLRRLVLSSESKKSFQNQFVLSNKQREILEHVLRHFDSHDNT